MKTLISQNGVKIFTSEFKQFYCEKCGALFESDEHNISNSTYVDFCPTCKSQVLLYNKEERDAKNNN